MSTNLTPHALIYIDMQMSNSFNLKETKMKLFATLFAGLFALTAFAADAPKKEEPKKDAPKAEAKKDAPKADAKKEEAKKAKPAKK